MVQEHCENCFAFEYCPDKGTENECKAEEKNDKIFQFNCGRGSGKQTKMLEAVIRWAESNKGCGAFALITADEAKRLSELEKWMPIINRLIKQYGNFERAKGVDYAEYFISIHKENKKLKQEIKIIGELLGTEAYVSNISYKIGCLKGTIARLRERLKMIASLDKRGWKSLIKGKIEYFTLKDAIEVAELALEVKDV